MLLKAFLSPPAASSALDGAKNRTPRKPRRLYLKMYKCLSFQEYQLLACAIKASPFFANTLLEANLNRDVLFDFMKGHEMYFLVIAIMTNWPRHLIKDFWEFFANSIITGKTLKARCLQISAHEENLKRNLYVVTLDIIIISCCSCSGEIFFWWSVKQRNASKSTVSCVFKVKVVVDSHKAVTDHTQNNQEWQKDHLWEKHPMMLYY